VTLFAGTLNGCLCHLHLGLPVLCGEPAAVLQSVSYCMCMRVPVCRARTQHGVVPQELDKRWLSTRPHKGLRYTKQSAG
jgi:hypothetical protein